jgi:hypothetical protein
MPKYLIGTLIKAHYENHNRTNNERFLHDIVFSIVDGFQATPMVKAVYRSLLIDAINDEISRQDHDIETNSDCFAILTEIFGWTAGDWSDYWDLWIDDEHIDMSFIVTIDDGNWHETPRVHGIFNK